MASRRYFECPTCSSGYSSLNIHGMRRCFECGRSKVHEFLFVRSWPDGFEWVKRKGEEPYFRSFGMRVDMTQAQVSQELVLRTRQEYQKRDEDTYVSIRDTDELNSWLGGAMKMPDPEAVKNATSLLDAHQSKQDRLAVEFLITDALWDRENDE